VARGSGLQAGVAPLSPEGPRHILISEVFHFHLLYPAETPNAVVCAECGQS